MEKKNVFFSCVMDDVYKEFSLKNIDSFKSILESELEEAKKEVDFKKIVLINRLLKNSNICLETVESLNDDLYSYISTLLSKIELEEVFTMPMNRISAYFKAMTNLVLNNPSLNKFTNREKDLIIMALILHDGLKSGLIKEKYTRTDHPLLVVDLLKENKSNLKLNEEELEDLCNMISSHMGPWNKHYDGNEVLPIPKSAKERFVHMCDYLSSKKFLEVEFDDINIKF